MLHANLPDSTLLWHQAATSSRIGSRSANGTGDHAKVQIGRRLAGGLVHVAEGPRGGRVDRSSGGPCGPKNACKTCALGMGGQRGGMVNELGHFPEVCKKSLQAMVADMQGAIRREFWQRYSPRELAAVLAPRAGSVRPAGRAGALHPRHRPVHADLLGGCARRGSWRSSARPRPTRLSGTSAAAAATRPASCCNSSPGSTARTTSTTAATTATRRAASD